MSSNRRTRRIILFLRSCRLILRELHKTLEPLDSLIVKLLLVYLLLEKAFAFAQ